MSGLLRVEVPVSIGKALICPALSEFVKRNPTTSVAVTLTNQPHSLIERAIDVAIRMDYVEGADLVAKPIYEARYVICGTPDLVKYAAADPSKLDPRMCLGLLTEGRATPTEWVLSKKDENVVIEPSGPLNFNSSDVLVNVALSGTGLIYVLDIFANRYLATGELVELYPDWTTRMKIFYAVASKMRMTSTKIRAFIEFLVQTLDSQPRANVNRAVQSRSLKQRA
jgi:LysR family transcriptional regulator for bpeEF and oprC